MAQLIFACLFEYLPTTYLKQLWQRVQPLVFLDMMQQVPHHWIW